MGGQKPIAAGQKPESVRLRLRSLRAVAASKKASRVGGSVEYERDGTPGPEPLEVCVNAVSSRLAGRPDALSRSGSAPCEFNVAAKGFDLTSSRAMELLLVAPCPPSSIQHRCRRGRCLSGRPCRRGHLPAHLIVTELDGAARLRHSRQVPEKETAGAHSGPSTLQAQKRAPSWVRQPGSGSSWLLSTEAACG